jgi:hypothetical protein
MKAKYITSWILRVLIAVILLQTLFYKFTGHPDSVYIFSQLGVEPYGRIGLGIVELITAILILIPKTMLKGTLLSFFIILGAIFSHFLVIGTNVKGDGGVLFGLALIVFSACIILLTLHRKQIQQKFSKLA